MPKRIEIDIARPMFIDSANFVVPISSSHPREVYEALMGATQQTQAAAQV